MSNWVEVTPSEYPWEREALEFVRARLPKHEPYRAWSNFEFIAGDGSINEVDLLVLSPRGMFLVEIKSWPERIEGDQGRWYRVREGGSRRAEDNPVLLANRKAKRLKSLLERQAVAGKRASLPFIAPLVFLSHPGVQPRLAGGAALGVCVRDADEGPHAGGLPGIVATVSTISASDRAARGFRPLTTQDSRLVARAMEAAGIRPSRRHRRVGDYELGELLEEGIGFQEYAAVHAALPGTARRVRVFAAGSGLERETVIAAAQREFRSLDALEHAGILRPREYVETELGPALLYDREPDALRLDEYLALHGERLDIEQRLDLVRQIGEAIAYAHAHGVVHRALAARSVLVCDAATRRPRVRVRDWHTAHRDVTTTGGGTLTAHLDELWQADDALYLAPEASRSTGGEHLDVFSLGAIAFHVFTGRPPASSLIERQQHLDAHGGLDIAAVIDGANELLRACVASATSPDVAQRTPSIRQVLADLDEVLDELTEPEEEDIDPTTASKGDVLAGYAVQARLGSGATAIAYLVEAPEEDRVLKVAINPSANERLRAEAWALRQVRDPGVVEVHRDDLLIGGHAAILIDYAGEQTLAQRISEGGRLGLELLERWGEDLLRIVSTLEERGVAHRDIKPANIGLRRRGRESRLRLVLFDFSLSGTSLDAVTAGTPRYLDPFLLRRGRWDLHAERFAAAITLHEMATGHLPRWGDGRSDPAALDVEVTIEPDNFDPVVAEPLSAFFARALARDTERRFDTAEDMLRAWRECFRHAARPVTEPGDMRGGSEALARATPATSIGEIGLSPRARSALSQAGIGTVAQLLDRSEFELRSLRGVGAETRAELLEVLSALRERLADALIPDVQGLDLLVPYLVPGKAWADEDLDLLRALLGLEGPRWATVAEVAEHFCVSRARVEEVLGRGRERWYKSLRSVTRLREEIGDVLRGEAGVLEVGMLEDAVLALRGAVAEGEERRRLAAAAARAAIEAEARRESPRYVLARLGTITAVVAPATLEPGATLAYLEALARHAEQAVAGGPLIEERALSAMRELDPPAGLALSDERLLRLAAACTDKVAITDRRELYPVGLSAELAVRRAASALPAGIELTIEQVQTRVLSRYPRASKPPGRPELDQLLAEHGLRWDDARARYCAPGIPELSTIVTRQTTTAGGEPADRFAQRLGHARERFLALTVRPRQAAAAERALQRLEGVTLIALDAVLISHMRAIASEKGATWEAVLQLDAAEPGSRNWQILLGLARDATDRLKAQLLATPGTVLVVRAGLLGRYGQLTMLDEVRRQIEAPDGDHALRGLWLLVPAQSSSGRPVIDGVAVPVLDENEFAAVPSAWIQERAA